MLYLSPLHCVGFLQPQRQTELALGYWLSEEQRPHAERSWLLATCSCDRGWVSEQSWRHELA